jgi:hypothetical protein
MVEVLGVTLNVPVSAFKLLVFTFGVMRILEAPVRIHDRVLDWPGRILAGEAEKDAIVGRVMLAPPPPPPPDGAGDWVVAVAAVEVAETFPAASNAAT